MLNPFVSIVSIRSFPSLPLSIPLAPAFSPPVSTSRHLSHRSTHLLFIGFLPCLSSVKRQLRDTLGRAAIGDRQSNDSGPFDIFLDRGIQRERTFLIVAPLFLSFFALFVLLFLFCDSSAGRCDTRSAPQKKEYAPSSRWPASHSTRDRYYFPIFVLLPSLVSATRNMERFGRSPTHARLLRSVSFLVRFDGSDATIRNWKFEGFSVCYRLARGRCGACRRSYSTMYRAIPA